MRRPDATSGDDASTALQAALAPPRWSDRRDAAAKARYCLGSSLRKQRTAKTTTQAAKIPHWTSVSELANSCSSKSESRSQYFNCSIEGSRLHAQTN